MISDPFAGSDLLDKILDWASANTNATRRSAAMDRAHAAGHDACEVCGLALVGNHKSVEGIPLGPTCAKRLRRAGVIL
jgi:hypothetical protein